MGSVLLRKTNSSTARKESTRKVETLFEIRSVVFIYGLTLWMHPVSGSRVMRRIRIQRRIDVWNGHTGGLLWMAAEAGARLR